MKRIVSIGECMIELSDAPARRGGPLMRRAYGGDTLNTAVYAARCLAGRPARVDYVTALGDDPFSDEMMQAWRDEGVGTELVLRLQSRRPGLYLIRTDAAGERSFYFWRSAAAARDVIRVWGAETLAERLSDADLLYFSGISLAILDPESRAALLLVAQRLRERGAMVAFDSNHRAILWESPAVAADWIGCAWQIATLALPTFEDEQALFGDRDPEAVASRLQALGVSEVVVKQGSEPCLVAEGEARERVPCDVDFKPVDTTGAGDSFNAAYLVERLFGASPSEAAAAGHRLAARVVGAPGAIVPRDSA